MSSIKEYFDWLVRHEKLVATITLALVVALGVQLKFCTARVGPQADAPPGQPREVPAARPPGSVSNIAGKWEMIVEKKKGGEQIWTLTLEQSGESLKGVINSEGGDLPVTGSVKGQSISLSATRYGVTVEFPATHDGDTMRGTMRALTITRQWRAKRM